MAAQKNPLGPTGNRLRKNIKRLRETKNLSYAELSRRLADAGRGIPTLGLSRIEEGKRRIDADDLVALADVLGFSTNDLLFGSEENAPVTLPSNLSPDQMKAVLAVVDTINAAATTGLNPAAVANYAANAATEDTERE